MRLWFGWITAGLVFEVLAAWVAVGWAGAGHGTYVPAAILFPFTMAISVVVGRIPLALVALALAQYPIYGAVVAFSQRSLRVCVGLACAHAATAAAALFLMMRSGDFA